MFKIFLYLIKILVIESMLLSLGLMTFSIYIRNLDLVDALLNMWWFWLLAVPFYILLIKLILESWVVMLYVYLKDNSFKHNITRQRIAKLRIDVSVIVLPLILSGVISEKMD